MKESSLNRHPEWLRVKDFDRSGYQKTLEIIEKNCLNTVCLSANCPNRYECFSKGTATFMILGNICTRNCRYCNIKQGVPEPVDKKEPQRIGETIKKMNLSHAVITCVTRDDLDDGGAEQFVQVALEIKKKKSDCKIELLISDLKGDFGSLEKILKARPELINHNIEVAKDLFPKLRPQGDYNLSLELLRKVKDLDPEIITKSGFMIGLGEDQDQVARTLKDLSGVGCDVVTVGQYLRPGQENVPVEKYYTPREFKEIQNLGLELGIKKVISSPLTRSSYKAHDVLGKNK